MLPSSTVRLRRDTASLDLNFFVKLSVCIIMFLPVYSMLYWTERAAMPRMRETTAAAVEIVIAAIMPSHVPDVLEPMMPSLPAKSCGTALCKLRPQKIVARSMHSIEIVAMAEGRIAKRSSLSEILLRVTAIDTEAVLTTAAASKVPKKIVAPTACGSWLANVWPTT